MLKLGVVQMSVIEGDVEENKKRCEAITEKYAGHDIDLLCFPELCISGYDFEKAVHSEKESEFFAQLAETYNIAILAGVHIAEGKKHYDTACIWNEKGKLLGEYRKIHLWDKENDFFEKGEELVVVPFKGWNIGLLICADYGFPELSTPLAQKKNADVIIYPSAWGEGWEDLFMTCSKMRAAENQVYTVALNRASGDVNYCGNTAVCNPDGSTLVRLATTEQAYVRVVLEKHKLQDACKCIPWRKMKRYGLYSGF